MSSCLKVQLNIFEMHLVAFLQFDDKVDTIVIYWN